MSKTNLATSPRNPKFFWYNTKKSKNSVELPKVPKRNLNPSIPSVANQNILIARPPSVQALEKVQKHYSQLVDSVINITEVPEFRFKSKEQLHRAKELSLNIKHQIITDFKSIKSSDLTEVLFYHLCILRLIINKVLTHHSKCDFLKTYQFLTANFYYLENALNASYIYNKVNNDTLHNDNLLVLENISLLLYTKILSKFNLPGVIENLQIPNDRHFQLFKVSSQSKVGSSKTAFLKLPPLRREILESGSRFIRSIVLHKNLIPQLMLKNYNFDLEIAPKWLVAHFKSVYIKGKNPEFITRTEVDNQKKHFGELDIYKYFDILENSVSKSQRCSHKLRKSIVASPLGSIYFHVSHNNREEIKSIIENRQKLANLSGYPDYHQYILARSPRKVFNFGYPSATSLDSINSWLMKVSKINRALLEDFVNITSGYEKFMKDHDMRYMISKFIQENLRKYTTSNTFFTAESVIQGMSNILYKDFGLTLDTKLPQQSGDKIVIEVKDNETKINVSTIICDLAYSPSKFSFHHRYDTNLVCTRRSKDSETLIYIVGNQCSYLKLDNVGKIHYPMTFFYMCDFVYAIGKALEYSFNPYRLMTVSSIPLGSESLISNYLIHKMTLNSIISKFVDHRLLNLPKNFQKNKSFEDKCGKVLSNAISMHKIVDFAERCNKALFDLHSHNVKTINSIFDSETKGSICSSFLFKNWNTCFPLLMDRKNRFYYSFTNSYVNFYATLYYTNIVADISSYNLMHEKLMDLKGSAHLKNRFYELLNPCYNNLDKDLIALSSVENLHRYFKHYSECLKPIVD